jgi:exopolysaccharide production protein ExoZ
LSRHREPPPGGVAIQGRKHRAGPVDCFFASAPRNDETAATAASRGPRAGYGGASSESLRTIQALRAIACLMVVVFHAIEAQGRVFRNDAHAVEVWPNGAAGVDLFFVISGLVMTLHASKQRGGRPDAVGFMRGRIERIVPLYWLFSALKLAQMLALPGLSPHIRPTLWNSVASFLFVPSRDSHDAIFPLIAAGWTLNFEMFFYVWLAIAMFAGWSLPGFVAAVFVPLAILGAFCGNDWPAVTSLASPLLLEFCMGAAIARAFPTRRALPVPIGAFLLLAGFAALVLLPQHGNWQALTWGLPAAAVVWGAVSLEHRLGPWLPSISLAIGDASYAVYLTHSMALATLFHLIAHLPPPWGDSATLVVAVSLVFCSATGWLVHRGIEKPIMVWLKRRRATVLPSPSHRFAMGLSLSRDALPD